VVKWPEYDGHLAPSNAKVKNAWSFTSTPPYVLTAPSQLYNYYNHHHNMKLLNAVVEWLTLLLHIQEFLGSTSPEISYPD
jgi:hypothetical protein